ncbi:MAG: SDR family oxidoreductase [Oscillospiraceae bacterium]
MKSIFITGLAGMLGSNIAFLLRDKYNIFGIDKNPVDIEGVQCEEGSALDTLRVEEIIEENHIDIFIHCAALVNVDLCEQKPDYAEIVNYEMTNTLRKICRKLGVKFIFISTDAVFPGTQKGLNCETDVTAPISVYGKTKLRAENAVLENEDSLVIRTNIYGFNYRDKNSFGEWVVQALNSDEAPNMFTDLTFSPILVNHFVEILDRCIDQDLKGVYHISSTGMISKYDLGVAIQKAFDIRGMINPISMKDYKFAAPRTQNMGLDNGKIKRELGIEINSPYEDAEEFCRLWKSGYGKRLKEGRREK